MVSVDEWRWEREDGETGMTPSCVIEIVVETRDLA